MPPGLASPSIFLSGSVNNCLFTIKSRLPTYPDARHRIETSSMDHK